VNDPGIGKERGKGKPASNARIALTANLKAPSQRKKTNRKGKRKSVQNVKRTPGCSVRGLRFGGQWERVKVRDGEENERRGDHTLGRDVPAEQEPRQPEEKTSGDGHKTNQKWEVGGR